MVKHPVNCQPVVPDGTQPPYAEDEIQIYPYPLITGRTTESERAGAQPERRPAHGHRDLRGQP